VARLLYVPTVVRNMFSQDLRCWAVNHADT